MTEEEQRRFDSLEKLRAAAYASFNDRRGHEWKLSISIWTALAIVLAGLAQPTKAGDVFPFYGTHAWVGFAIAGLLLTVLHAAWSHWASQANYIDNKIQFHFRDEMMNVTLKLPLSAFLHEEIESHPLQSSGWRQRSHFVQVCITLLLVVGAVLIVYARSN